MITYLKGDATQPQDTLPTAGYNSSFRVIAHICNSSGGWGRGFVLAVSKRWSGPESRYRLWSKNDPEEVSFNGPFTLGGVQIVKVERDVWVANMIAQEGYGGDGKPPVRYGALEACLTKLAEHVGYMVAPTIHMPRIGTGLGKGDWRLIEPLIERALERFPVFVYDYDPRSSGTPL